MGVIASQPAFVVVFGQIKLGKTTDMLMSFPRALFIAAPGALKSSIGVAGFEPPPNAVKDVASLEELVNLILSLKPGQYDAIVVDDFTLYVQRQIQITSRSSGGFDLWAAIYRFVLAIREAARRCGMHFAMTMHELPPRVNDGVKLPGSPMLPGNKLPFDVPAAADMVLRAQPFSAAMATGLGWPVLYRCDPSDSEWRTGDRHNVTPDMSPMNLGEILRLVAREAGAPPTWAPKRLPGFEWQEALVEKGAGLILVGNPQIAADKRPPLDIAWAKIVMRQLHDAVIAKHSKDERHALWTCRDAWDRAVLRNALGAHRRKFFGF